MEKEFVDLYVENWFCVCGVPYTLDKDLIDLCSKRDENKSCCDETFLTSVSLSQCAVQN